ncbi:hypothetical protein [Plantibacter sp. YIM 135347]|uniref:hypothetical protein n=1 Tax=Plantibacter sp. YIM 135347 TaxID=3423919 RepID=UPI003D341956
MDDEELGMHLREAAPQVSVPVGLGTHRARILAEARMRRGRRFRVWGATAALSALLVGGGSVAMAGSDRSTPWGWVADNVSVVDRANGSACFQGFQVRWSGLAEDDPMVVDARAIVSSIDVEALDTSQVEARMRAERAQELQENPNLVVEELSDAAIKRSAVHSLVADLLWDGLEARGHRMWLGHEVSLASQTTDCS